MIFTELSKLYLDSVEFDQLELNTQAMYKSWALRVPRMATMNAKEMFHWLKALPVRAGTKNLGLSVLRGIYSWGELQGFVDANPTTPIKRFRSTVTMPKGYTKAEINAVCAQAASPTEELCACFLKIMFWTGARPREILDLKWGDIDYDNSLIAIMGAKKREKGVVSRYCNLLPIITDCLQELYEGERRHGDDTYVFKLPGFSMGNRRLHINYARKRLQLMGKRVGINKTLRQARTGLATSMLANGYSITDVQQTLGHKTILATQRYIRPSLKEKAEVFKGLK